MKQQVLGWAAIVVVVAGAGLGLREYERPAAPQAALTRHEAIDASVLRIGRGPEGRPQPIRLDAAMARRALKAGVLEVALADGTTYPVRIEREETRGAHWSLIGRVATPMGEQAMVLTFGANAVFGLLPMPNGHALHVTTGENGVVSVAPAGGLSPDLAHLRSGETDYRIPEGAPAPQQVRVDASAARTSAASMPTRVHTVAGGTTTGTTALATPRASITVDTTPVQINVLALYSPELVALRGSQSAAETEVANMFALANQAHLDSGSRVRLNMVGLREVALPAAETNQQVLDRLTYGKFESTDFEALRDDDAADLTAFIRPRPTVEDATCGASWLNGGGYRAVSGLQATHGSVVVNVEPCGAYVLAHELGHAMGSAHDKRAQRGPDGVVAHGAFAFSFGLRTETFATIMADPGDAVWLGRFSGPDPTGCNGVACGEAERIDNVRSLNLMAPAIAAFRGTKNTISIADAFVSEGGFGYLGFAIRLSAPAPPEGLEVHVDITGGTANLTEDYWDSYNHDLRIPGGEREVIFPITQRNDRPQQPVIEPAEETVFVHLSAPDGITVERADAVGTILDDDPRPVVTLKIHGPEGVAMPDSFLFTWFGNWLSDTSDKTEHIDKTGPNEWSIALPVAAGAPFRFNLTQSSLYKAAYVHVVQLDEVWEDRTVNVQLERTLRVTGTIKMAPGLIKPTNRPMLDVTQFVDGVARSYGSAGFPVNEEDFEFYVFPGASVETYINEMPYPVDGNIVKIEPFAARFQDIRQDFSFSPVRSTVKSIIGRPLNVTEGQDAIIEFEQVTHSMDAPITVRWHTVDGTARAGTHYVAASGTTTLAPEQRSASIAIQTIDNGDNAAGRTFDVIVDQVTGAAMVERRLHVTVRNDDARRTGGGGQKFRSK